MTAKSLSPVSFHLSVTIAGLLSLIAGIIFSPPVVPLPAVFTILVIFFCLQLYSPIQLLNGRYYLSNILLLGLAFLIGFKQASLVFVISVASRTLLIWLAPRSGERKKPLQSLISESGFLIGENLFPLLFAALLFGWHDTLILVDQDYSHVIASVLGSTLTFGLLHGVIFWSTSRLEVVSPFSKARWDSLALILLELLPVLLLYQTIITFSILELNTLIILGTLTTFLSILLNYLSAPRLELERRLYELSALSAVSKTLSSEIDLDKLLTSIQAQVEEILNVQNFYVALYDPPKKEIWYPLAIKDGLRQYWPRRKFLDRLTDRVIQEGKPILIRHHAKRELTRIGLPAGEDSPFAWIGVPLVAADQVTGCIAAFSLSPEVGFSEQDLHILSILAGQTSVAIEIALHNALLTSHVLIGSDRLTAVLNSVQDGLLLLEASGHITLVNERVSTITGLERTEFIGRKLAELPEAAFLALGFAVSDLSVAAKAEFTASLVQQMEEKVTYALDGHIPMKHLERTVFPVQGESGELSGWVILIRDITQDVEALEARELLGETLVHDLRSPISSIISALEMIQDAHTSGDPTSLIGPSLQIARRSAKRVLAMIESLLEITRLQTGKLKLDFTSVEIRSLVDSCLAEFGSQARDYELSIENSVPADLPKVLMDRGKIFRVLNNLVDNALKFTREQGEVRITAEISPEGDLQVGVSDAGPGIPEEYRQKIFERFTQVPGQLGRRKGSGLGLTYCKLAVEAHQGRIWVEPRPGGGSIFVFTLPLNR